MKRTLRINQTKINMCKNKNDIYCIITLFFQFGILIVIFAITNGSGLEEFCEDEQINLHCCPLHPSIDSALDRIHNEAYLVCEADVLSPCAEHVAMEDQTQSATATTRTTTTGQSTILTTTTAVTIPTTGFTRVSVISTPITETSASPVNVICPSCVPICDEDRRHCDMSEPILTSRTTFDLNKIYVNHVSMKREVSTSVTLSARTETIEEIRQQFTASVGEMILPYRNRSFIRTTPVSTKGRSHYKTVNDKPGLFSLDEQDLIQLRKLNRPRVRPTARLRVPQAENTYGFPKILFDTFKKQPIFKDVKTFDEIKDQLHILKVGHGHGDSGSFRNAVFQEEGHGFIVGEKPLITRTRTKMTH